MYRRDFIRLASLAASSLPFTSTPLFTPSAAQSSETLLTAVHEQLSTADLQKLFRNPPNAYRPMVRWWWNGDRVTAEEVTRELDVLQKAGIGGVEINPIKFPQEASALDTHALTWMSDEWIAVLAAALDAAKQRDMTCDMIVGSGWPYGGEFLTRADQTQMMALGTRESIGPQSIRLSVAELLADVSPRFVSPFKDPLKELISCTLVPYELNSVDAAVPVTMHTGDETIALDIPDGRYVLYFLVKLTGFMAVINGAPGASGPVLNHYSAPAVSRYLNRISDRLTAKIGPLGNHFRAFFTDSIELEGENWCDDMLAQFHSRRGYDLAPYLPCMLFKIGEMGNAIASPYGAHFSASLEQKIQSVRYDFETTKHELFQERFVATFANWCTQNGVKSRMQAYGMECDPISSSMMIDIPECETWIRTESVEAFGTGTYTTGRDYTMINKFVASGAHLSGKRLISCEEMTNTDDPFHTSLDRLKVAGDQNMLTGVTHSIVHGFNYSPMSIPFPGWVRYGTYFSERNTWWPYFRLWTDYKARLYVLLQHAEMQADIAILPPNADLAAHYGFQRDPFPKVSYPKYLYKIWEAVQQNGSGCDYLTEEIIQQSKVSDGRITYGTRSYKALLLPEVESMHPATVKQLHALAASGGTIIFLGKTPHQAAGLVNHAEESADVLAQITAIRTTYPEQTPLLNIDEDDMVNWYRAVQQRYALHPDVVISKPTDFISQIHYRRGEQDIFFFTHHGPQEQLTLTATFNTGDKIARLWDAENGDCYPLEASGEKNVLTLTLGPAESLLIVFDPMPERTSGDEAVVRRPSAQSVFYDIEGPWIVELNHIDGTRRTITLPQIADFDQRPDLASFAGTILYRKQFTLTRPEMPHWLSLGEIHAVSELTVNGRSLGVRWYGDQTYNVSGVFKHGVNQIEIKVVTTLGNYMKTLTANPTAQAWTADTPNYPLGLIKPVRLSA